MLMAVQIFTLRVKNTVFLPSVGGDTVVWHAFLIDLFENMLY